MARSARPVRPDGAHPGGLATMPQGADQTLWYGLVPQESPKSPKLMARQTTSLAAATLLVAQHTAFLASANLQMARQAQF